MAFAILSSGGKQYRVKPGDVIEVERMNDAEPGPLTLHDVLMVNTDDGVRIGNPILADVFVESTVLGHTRGKKLNVVTYHAKKRNRTRRGHRQELTRLRIDSIGPRTEPEEPITANPKAAAKPKAAA